MCICCCTCAAYGCAYVRERVMFDVYGGESESMSDQYRFFFCFYPFIKHIAFRSMTAAIWPFLLFHSSGVKWCNLMMQCVCISVTKCHRQQMTGSKSTNFGMLTK